MRSLSQTDVADNITPVLYVRVWNKDIMSKDHNLRSSRNLRQPYNWDKCDLVFHVSLKRAADTSRHLAVGSKKSPFGKVKESIQRSTHCASTSPLQSDWVEDMMNDSQWAIWYTIVRQAGFIIYVGDYLFFATGSRLPFGRVTWTLQSIADDGKWPWEGISQTEKTWGSYLRTQQTKWKSYSAARIE